MGSIYSTRKKNEAVISSDEVNFNHFNIMRSIGKGTFGKVCIVEKKDTKKLYAMKYMNKKQCIQQDALKNVLRELDILMSLNYPFIVNLWFSFQDEEDFFMVGDIMFGGDLRFQLQQKVHFDENSIRLYFCELSLALDYLKQNRVIHRDIKPDNVLLDKHGHVHLTDFNVAIRLKTDNDLINSLSGTKPYMAPEIFKCSLFPDRFKGYSYAVDWWSLGILGYELMSGQRPFEYHQKTSSADMILSLHKTDVVYDNSWSDDFVSVLNKLLDLDPNNRLSSLKHFKKQNFVKILDFDKVYRKEYVPNFIPSAQGINCDPSFELEEMIVESKPLHKKNKRLAKQRSLQQKRLSIENEPDNVAESTLFLPKYKTYNRLEESEKHLPVKNLNFVMSDQSLEDVCHWIDKYTISRVKKNLNRDFSDAVPLAEMLKMHYPKQVDLHNYVPTTSFPKKMTNWEVLNRKVLQRMRINLSKQVMQELANSKPGAIEALLKTVKKAVEKDNEKRVLDVENARYRGHVYRVPICTTNGSIEYRELVKASIVEDKNREINQKKGDIESLQQEIVHLQNLMKVKDEKISFLSNKVTGSLKPALSMTNTKKMPKTPNSGAHSWSSNEEVASI